MSREALNPFRLLPGMHAATARLKRAIQDGETILCLLYTSDAADD